MQQIITQTEKLEVVKSVTVLTRENGLYRDMLLMKVQARPEDRQAIKNIVDIYRGRIVDLSRDSLIVELTGTPNKINGFIDVMADYNIQEVCRTGITAIEVAENIGEGDRDD